MVASDGDGIGYVMPMAACTLSQRLAKCAIRLWEACRHWRCAAQDAAVCIVSWAQPTRHACACAFTKKKLTTCAKL